MVINHCSLRKLEVLVGIAKVCFPYSRIPVKLETLFFSVSRLILIQGYKAIPVGFPRYIEIAALFIQIVI